MNQLCEPQLPSGVVTYNQSGATCADEITSYTWDIIHQTDIHSRWLCNQEGALNSYEYVSGVYIRVEVRAYVLIARGLPRSHRDSGVRCVVRTCGG